MWYDRILAVSDEIVKKGRMKGGGDSNLGRYFSAIS